MTQQHVHLVGAGLIGASIGIGLTAAGWDPSIEDADASAEQVAWRIGAGRALRDAQSPSLVIVAVSPAATPDVVVASLRRPIVIVELSCFNCCVFPVASTRRRICWLSLWYKRSIGSRSY